MAARVALEMSPANHERILSDVRPWNVSARQGADTPDVDAFDSIRRGAKALVTSRGRVLLIKERRSDGSTFWSLPGGGVKRDESMPECLRREVAEEIRCDSSVGPAVGSAIYCHTNRPVATVYTVFEVALRTEPEPNPTQGIVDHAWRRPTDLPPATLTPIANVVSGAVPRE